MELQDSGALELAVSDYSQLASLASYLDLVVPDARVTRMAGQPGPGEQGALDVLMVAADSSVLVAAIKVLPEFLRSRKKGLSIAIKLKDRQLTLTSDSADDAMRVVDRFLDG
jgi:hypothetical protein